MGTHNKEVGTGANSTDGIFIPMRQDGMPDLNAVDEFIEKNGYATINDIQLAIAKSSVEIELVFLNMAADRIKKVVTNEIIEILSSELLSVKEALEIVSMVQTQILETKLSH